MNIETSREILSISKQGVVVKSTTLFYDVITTITDSIQAPAEKEFEREEP